MKNKKKKCFERLTEKPKQGLCYAQKDSDNFEIKGGGGRS